MPQPEAVHHSSALDTVVQTLPMLLVPLALAGWAYTYRQMRADGDDDWFRRAGRRVRRWASSLGRSPAPAPVLQAG